MKRVEITYTEYTMTALLHTVGIRDVAVLPEGSAEALSSEMGRRRPRPLDVCASSRVGVCVVAGGCTGDVTISQASSTEGWRTVFKSTHALHDASSIRLNVRLTRRILRLCDRQTLAEHYDWMVEQARFGVASAQQAARLFFRYMYELMDSLKSQIETNHRRDIIHNVPDTFYHLRWDVYGFLLDVRVPIDGLYVPELLASIDVSVTRAVDVMRNFYVAFPEYGPITRVHFSGGVFHSAAGVTLASQRFVAMVEACDTLRPRLRMEEDPSKNARSSFGAGCLGALGILMELRRQATGRTVQTLEYERSDCDVQTLACPRLHARDATTESQWKFEIRGRGGGGVLVKACVGEEVRVPCLSHEGVAFLGITAVKYGGRAAHGAERRRADGGHGVLLLGRGGGAGPLRGF